ncbi:acyl-CoA/acyl-ACP dehydrogenase [Rhodococcus sp. T2V]|uniref:acyl-CoA dehydrogenase family protein n=1 Tax=Rhodococcus sp. T2V TaxID=3034164 RepID=UPI0023E28684|nr:acyl-CoA dehydrogenase family protein [Rhodococcus sp. T2V]MDF3310052.1 acyl-CoA/acyl-ACP dehydrogenase [Rhodococcus sp. T2V]
MSKHETPEQREIRSTARSMLTRAQPIAAARTAEGDYTGGFDPVLWRQLSQELGVTALVAPESVGGLELGLVDVGVVLEETGRACYNGPALESAVLTPQLLKLADQDVEGDWAELVEESRIATIAGIGRIASSHRRDTAAATRSGDEWVLDGAVFGVPHGLIADTVYVVADCEAGTGVWAVTADADGHQRKAMDTLDLTRPMALHRFASTPARLVLSATADPERLHLLIAGAVTALSAEQVGIAQHLLELTVDYVRTRYQFGRAIGSFQAVKHRCVNMAIATEGATAASSAARDAVDAASPGDAETVAEALRLSALAGAYCSDAVVDVAGAALQLHGGIGMSWEHDIHIYLRRAKVAQSLLGAPRDHRRALSNLLGLHSASA